MIIFRFCRFICFSEGFQKFIQSHSYLQLSSPFVLLPLNLNCSIIFYQDWVGLLSLNWPALNQLQYTKPRCQGSMRMAPVPLLNSSSALKEPVLILNPGNWSHPPRLGLGSALYSVLSACYCLSADKLGF